MNMLCGKQSEIGSLGPKIGAQNLSRVEGRVLSQNAVAAEINRTAAKANHQARDRARAWAARGWGIDSGALGAELNSLSEAGVAGLRAEAAWGHSKCGM